MRHRNKSTLWTPPPIACARFTTAMSARVNRYGRTSPDFARILRADKAISDSVNCPHKAGRLSKLLAQPRHVRIHRPRIHRYVAVPHVFEEALSALHASVLLRQNSEQPELSQG